MSFTSKTKEEILNSKLLDKATTSFISAIIHSSGSLSLDNSGLGFEITSESKALIQKSSKIISKLFGVEQKIVENDNISPNKKTVYICRYRGESARDILEKTKIVNGGEELEIVFGIEEGLFDSELDEKLYILGSFLGAGSVVVPETEGDKGYHLEFAFSNGIMADDFASLLLRNGFNPKFANRKEKCLIYFKDIDSILNMLAFLDASRAVLVINEIVIERESRNRANRQTNCQLANIDKAVLAAEKQIQAIEKIKDTVGLDYLDEKLKAIAELRLKHYDVGLVELGQRCDPPISKSGVNHRLRKLVKIAEELE